jgi:hypothetical protein
VRTRVIAACTVAFVTFSVLLSFVLPRSFRAFAVEDLRERTRSMAASAALHSHGSGVESLADVALALEGELDFESLARLDAEGRAIAVWPTGARGWDAPVRRAEQLEENRDHFLAIAPIGGREAEWIAVRTSTARLRQDLASVTALLLALLLSIGSALLALAVYLLRAVLGPLEEIRLAALQLADGGGEAEVDELGALISELSDDARRREAGAASLELIPRREAHVPRVAGSERRRGDRRAPGVVPE